MNLNDSLMDHVTGFVGANKVALKTEFAHLMATQGGTSLARNAQLLDKTLFRMELLHRTAPNEKRDIERDLFYSLTFLMEQTAEPAEATVVGRLLAFPSRDKAGTRDKFCHWFVKNRMQNLVDTLSKSYSGTFEVRGLEDGGIFPKLSYTLVWNRDGARKEIPFTFDVPTQSSTLAEDLKNIRSAWLAHRMVVKACIARATTH